MIHHIVGPTDVTVSKSAAISSIITNTVASGTYRYYHVVFNHQTTVNVRNLGNGQFTTYRGENAYSHSYYSTYTSMFKNVTNGSIVSTTYMTQRTMTLSILTVTAGAISATTSKIIRYTYSATRSMYMYDSYMDENYYYTTQRSTYELLTFSTINGFRNGGYYYNTYTTQNENYGYRTLYNYADYITKSLSIYHTSGSEGYKWP